MTAALWILASVFILGGITAFIAGITGARWFFSAAGSRAFTGRRHNAAARVIYTIAGLLMIAAGLNLLPISY
ncbi:MAG: hypothetical protein HDR92_01435 [Bacteroides sp.]|nr:hypothetical protein [Bacteroides sp.]